MNFLLKTSLLALLFLGSCTDNPKTGNENPNEKTHAVKPVEIKTWTSIYDEEDLKIEANSDINEEMIQEVSVKFQPYIWFEDFPAKTIDTISKAPLDFSTNREAKWYITAIKNGYKEERSKFGGHYELIMWGCGSPCYHGVIVDRKTGQMIHLPLSGSGYEFRSNSLMLVVNPTGEDGFYGLKNSDIMPPTIYVFDEVKKEFRLLEPKGK